MASAAVARCLCFIAHYDITSAVRSPLRSFAQHLTKRVEREGALEFLNRATFGWVRLVPGPRDSNQLNGGTGKPRIEEASINCHQRLSTLGVRREQTALSGQGDWIANDRLGVAFAGGHVGK